MTAWNPLIFVIGLSMLRELFEDYFRDKADKVANGMPTKVFRGDNFVQVSADKVKVGDILLVENE
jgi:phospholipid-translocating ATPase